MIRTPSVAATSPSCTVAARRSHGTDQLVSGAHPFTSSVRLGEHVDNHITNLGHEPPATLTTKGAHEAAHFSSARAKDRSCTRAAVLVRNRNDKSAHTTSVPLAKHRRAGASRAHHRSSEPYDSVVMSANIGAFLGVAALVIITPGPDTALTIRNALRGGRRGGVLTAAGVSTGQAIWALASCAGVATLLQVFGPVDTGLRWLGAAYLMYLGASSLWRACHHREADDSSTISASRSLGTTYRQGLLSNLGNPKMAVFFVSLLPQFAGTDPHPFLLLALLGLTFCIMTFAWLSVYSVVVAKVGDVLRRSSVRRALDALTGLALIGLGLRVATEG